MSDKPHVISTRCSNVMVKVDTQIFAWNKCNTKEKQKQPHCRRHDGFNSHVTRDCRG